MKNSKLKLMVLGLGILALIAVLNVVNKGVTSPVAAGADLGALPASVLPQDQLLDHALEAAQYFGLQNESFARQAVDMSQGMYTTYEESIRFMGGVLGDVMYETGQAQLPVLILPISGISYSAKRGMRQLNTTPRPAADKVLVAIFADNGMPVWSQGYGSGQLFPSFDTLATYSLP